jgi:nicotinamidase/pyrazinamidase
MPPTGKAKESCLVVVDVQYDFMPGGALAVASGDEVVPVINALLPRFENVVLTQDWHPRGHASFASAHAGKKPFETTRLPYGDQVLWPDHCVQGTKGAEIHADLQATKAQLVIRKGFHEGIDSYSGFVEADRKTLTGLAGYLKARGIREVFVCGLPRTSASPGRRSTPAPRASRPRSSRMPRARST